jgi:hypothetical protein
MSTTLASPTPAVHSRGATHRRASTRRGRALPRPQRTAPESRQLASYRDCDGREREVIASGGASASTLVIDRQAGTHEDARLVAHLAADEPSENATVVCERYLRDLAAGVAGCRALTTQDSRLVPFSDQAQDEPATATTAGGQPLADGRDCVYSLELVPSDMSIPELRWWRRPSRLDGVGEPVSLREAIAAIESYQPLCALTETALRRHEPDPRVSRTVLRAELTRVHSSPIVLNRLLRETVLAVVARDELSMSEIAIRCGRIKRDRKGNEAGETSWLARRLGLAPEGGRSTPTPWIHSDVLALIARSGLGLSPREVEL